MVSCAALTDPIIPSYAPPMVYGFVGMTNAPKNRLGFTSLKETKRLKAMVEIQHVQNELKYFTAKGLNDKAISASEGLQTRLFDPDTGYVSLGLAALGGGGLSALTYLKGKKTPRPGDVPKEQHEAEKKLAGMMDPEVFKQTV